MSELMRELQSGKICLACGGHGENSSGAFPGVAVAIVFSSYGHVQSVPLSLCQQAGHSKLFCSAASLNSCYRTSIHTSHRQPGTQTTAPEQLTLQTCRQNTEGKKIIYKKIKVCYQFVWWSFHLNLHKYTSPALSKKKKESNKNPDFSSLSRSHRQPVKTAWNEVRGLLYLACDWLFLTFCLQTLVSCVITSKMLLGIYFLCYKTLTVEKNSLMWKSKK